MNPVSPILTVDVEDWFHVCGDSEYSDPSTWATRVKRVHVGVERILEALDGSSSMATFFVLGWIARQSPALVRRIAEAGHEIGCHGDLHRRVFEMSVEEFREDLRTARDTLQEILGSGVTSFRAPEWSMRSPENPAFQVLAEEGFDLDSSLVPARPVGLETNPKEPFFLDTPSGRILEVPPLMGTFFFRKAMLGGGVCSRLSRESRVHAAIERSIEAGSPPVLYLHPWEVDPQHPAMPLGLLGWLIHFAGRERTLPRLRRLLATYRMRPISSVRELVRTAAPAAVGAAA